MPTYITMWDYTPQGIENIHDSPERLDAAKEVIESVGGELTDFYLTMGEHDLVTVTEFPDDDAAGRAILKIGQSGAVSSQTMKAWPEGEYRDLIESLD